MALVNSLVFNKATCENIITRRAYIPQMSKELTGVPGAIISSPLAKSTGTTTAAPATLQLERRECDSLRRPTTNYRIYPNIAADMLLNCAEIEPMFVWCVKNH